LTELARLAGPVACAGLALLFLATRRDLRLAGLVAWALGSAVLGLYLAPAGREAELAAAGVIGLALAVGGAAVLLRWPWALAFATLACIPIRVPVDVGAEDANLLLPLYFVVASFALALGWRLLRGDERTRELGPLAIPLAAVVGWTGLALLWTDDVREGSIFLAAFVLPFGLLAIGFARLPWRRRMVVWLYAAVAATALAYAAVGLYQWATREVFWNPKLIVDNAYAPFFRVNSVFWDPSIYGRYLVVAILATLALLLLGLRGGLAAAAIAAIAATWVGLLFSFSQSSFVALIAGTLAIATLVWRWRAAATLGLLAVVLVSVGFATPQVRHRLLEESKAGLDAASSGRAGLVSNGLRIAADHPVAGVGTGSFKRAYADRTGLPGREPKRAASHSTPVTVAAETGLPGLALLAWLGAAALWAAFRVRSRSDAGRLGVVAGLTLGAIAVHSLFYNALFEDPTMWALLGLVALAVAQRAREVEPASSTSRAVAGRAGPEGIVR
jgi:putative inorganic carbon (HCO3(-)) transporter